MYAMTIVGGRGERLRPYTDNIPKAMVAINGRPLLAYQVDWMRANGVTDVIFLCGHLSEKIEKFVADGSDLGIRAHYSHEETPLGRGGAVRKGFALVPPDEERVLVVNGDVLTDQPLDPLIALHQEKSATATMMLIPYPSQYGVVRFSSDGLVSSFDEKPDLPHWINAGVYIFDRSIERILPEIGDHETETFPTLASEKQLAALTSSAFWTSVESAKELREVGERFATLGQ